MAPSVIFRLGIRAFFSNSVLSQTNPGKRSLCCILIGLMDLCWILYFSLSRTDFMLSIDISK